MRLRNVTFPKQSLWIVPVTLILIISSFSTAEQVNWQGPGGSRIKEIRYPKKETQPRALSDAPAAALTSTSTVLSNVIDSPPVDGFVPWIVVTATDEHLDAETTGIYEAFASTYVGNPPSGSDPRTDYFIGIFDTGASTHVIGHENAVQAGLYNLNFLTEDNYVEVSGVTGSIDTHVTHPYAIFMDGLDALEPNAPGESEMVLPTTAGMVGEYNVATLIGQDPNHLPDLATAIG